MEVIPDGDHIARSAHLGLRSPKNSARITILGMHADAARSKTQVQHVAWNPAGAFYVVTIAGNVRPTAVAAADEARKPLLGHRRTCENGRLVIDAIIAFERIWRSLARKISIERIGPTRS